MAERILLGEFRSLSREKWVNIELQNEDIFKWNVALIVLNQDSMYYGGYFKASMTFPSNYPYSPPAFRFLHPIWHPNIYPDGKLCISILHPPGDDEMSGELAAERWSPAQRVESVLISILSLLDDAEVSSPANVDAAVMLRTNPAKFRSVVKSNVEASKLLIPDGFEMPSPETPAQQAEKEDPDFWAESGDDSDPFGGSDSDGEMEFDNLTGSEEEEEEEDDDDDGNMDAEGEEEA